MAAATVLPANFEGLLRQGACPDVFSTEDIIERERDCGQALGPFHQKWLIDHRSPERVQKLLRKQDEIRQKRIAEMGSVDRVLAGALAARQGFASMDVADFPPTNFTANTVNGTATAMWTQTVWTPIPAGDMRMGKVYKVSFGGVFTTTATQGTNVWTPAEGTSATLGSNRSLGPSGAIAPAASITAGPWYGEFTLGIRAIDIALTAITGTGNGFVTTSSGTATGTMYPIGGLVPTTMSNAAATALGLWLLISVASQSYQANWALVRSYN